MRKFTASQIALQAHIEAFNAASGDNMFSVVSDPAHWEKVGITSIKEYERYMLEMDYYELFREVYDVKPRGTNLGAMTTIELEVAVQELRNTLIGFERKAQEAYYEQKKRDQVIANELNVSIETYNRWQEEEYGNNEYCD